MSADMVSVTVAPLTATSVTVRTVAVPAVDGAF